MRPFLVMDHLICELAGFGGIGWDLVGWLLFS